MRISRRSFTKRALALLAARSLPSTAFGSPAALAQSGLISADGATAGSGSLPPKFVCTDFSRRFDPAYLSNGLIGIRPGANPLAHALALGSGFIFEHGPYRME